MSERVFEIRDIRKKEQFVVDDAYLDDYAKLCGIYATGVYAALCRHADIYNQTCFPSIELLVRKLNISGRQVMRALRVLEDWNIIKRERTKGKGNRYWLIDKKHWTQTSACQSPVPTRHQCPTDTGAPQAPPSDYQSPEPVTDSHPKDSHIRIQNKGKNIYTPLSPGFESIPFEEIVSLLNLRTGSSFGHERQKTRWLIKARWKEGFRLEDFQKVIENMAAAWGQDPNMRNFLRPETLFSSKFESYLNWRIGKGSGNHKTSKYAGIGEVVDCDE